MFFFISYMVSLLEIRCPVLPDIPNGRMKTSGNTLGDVTVYECNEGFVMNDKSQSNRMCLYNSTWDSIQPSCLRELKVHYFIRLLFN